MLVIWLPEMTCPVSGFVRVRPGTPEKSPLAHAVGNGLGCDQGILVQTHTFIIEVEEGVILDDRTADGAAVGVRVQRRVVVGDRVHGVPILALEEPEGAAVELIACRSW